MSRDLPAPLADEISKPVLRPFAAIRIDLPDPVYVFSGNGRLSFTDNDGVMREWIGSGDLGALDTVSEATDGSAVGFKSTLFKIPAEFRDDIADQAERGGAYEVYAAALDETYTQVIGRALVWKGRVDDYRITDAGDTLSVEVSGESRAIDQRRPAIKRLTDEYQQRQYPGDKFFEYVSRMTEVHILWSQAPQSAVASGGGSSSSGGGAAFYAKTFE